MCGSRLLYVSGPSLIERKARWFKDPSEMWPRRVTGKIMMIIIVIVVATDTTDAHMVIVTDTQEVLGLHVISATGPRRGPRRCTVRVGFVGVGVDAGAGTVAASVAGVWVCNGRARVCGCYSGSGGRRRRSISARVRGRVRERRGIARVRMGSAL